MPRFESRVYRVKVVWDGGDYHLQVMFQKSEWTNVDYLGELGWQFVAFVPNHEEIIDDFFGPSEMKMIRMAVFQRELDEGEEMWTDIKDRN